MRGDIWRATIVLTLLCGAVAPVAAVPSDLAHDQSAATQTDEPANSTDIEAHIVELYPNPIAENDRGEYVRLSLPRGNWTITDGESTVTVQSRSEYVVLTDAPDSLPNGTEGRVVDASLSLSNAGERLSLRRSRTDAPTVQTVEYGTAPEGERWIRGAEDHWRPIGYEPRSATAVGGATATAFVLPDAPSVPVETLRSADGRLLLAGYTFGSERATDALVDAVERGVRVRVLVDDAPVGGISTRQARLLDRLVAAGIDVRVLGGPSARFRYHHAKYAVVDDSALVLTENWKPAGTGGADSRGWGVRIESPVAADELATVFHNDAGWRDARPWEVYRQGRTFTAQESAPNSYPEQFGPREVHVRNVTLLTAPGNAGSGVARVIDGANERVDVIQPTVEDGPMLAATRRAAERGVQVRLLLSSAWYVREENAALASGLNDWAERRGVPFEARLADPAGRYGKVHAKGVVADDVAVVGSLNWNPTSARENREVAVALRGEAVAAYYRQVFAADWRAGSGTVPRSLLLAAVGSVAGVILYAHRKIEFA